MIKTLFLIIVSYVIYFIFIPPLQVNDEPQHIKNIVSLANGTYAWLPSTQGGTDGRELPVLQKITKSMNFVDNPYEIPSFRKLVSLREQKGDYDMTGVFSYEAYYPPIYYIVGVFFYYLSKLSPHIFVQYYIIRFVSTLFYFSTVFVFIKILSLYTKKENITTSILLFFSINPLVLKMGIGINPDIAVTFFSLLFLYSVLSFSKRFVINNLIKISILSALAALVKISGVFTNLTFSAYLFLVRKVSKKTFSQILVFQGVFLLFVLPWLIFMFARYSNFFPEPFSTSCGKTEPISILQMFFVAVTSFRHTFMHYAGFMGPAWPHPFSWFFTGFVVVFVPLVFIGIGREISEKKKIGKIFIFYAASLFVLLFLLSLQHRVSLLDCDVQGRYILPAFPILSLFLYSGLKSLIKNDESASVILKGFSIFHYLFILFTVLLLRYYV